MTNSSKHHSASKQKKMQPHKKTLQSVIVKPTGADCNMNCSYCFYLEKKELYPEKAHPRMSDETLEELTKQLMEQSGQNIAITWQGGEPSMMGLDFFKKAVEYEIKYARGKRKNISNGFQTNGTLITAEWVEFFKQYNFLVGLSIDGPAVIHDRHRKLGKHGDSFKRVLNTLRLLQESNTEFNILSTVNDFSCQYPEEIYGFFKKLNIGWLQFIPILERQIENPKLPATFSATPEAYGSFLVDIFKLWFNDYTTSGNAPSIRFIENYFHRYLNRPAPECTMNATCGEYVVIEHNGDVYSCDYFVEPKWKLGNIHDGRLIDMINSKQQFDFGRLKLNVDDECKSCKWHSICFGNCPKYRFGHATENRYYFCESIKYFLDNTNNAFVELAKHFNSEPPPKGAYDSSGHFR